MAGKEELQDFIVWSKLRLGLFDQNFNKNESWYTNPKRKHFKRSERTIAKFESHHVRLTAQPASAVRPLLIWGTK